MHINELQNRDYNVNGITNEKLTGICTSCNEEYTYSSIKNFIRSRNKNIDSKPLWSSCKKCWARISIYDNTNWIDNNSKAQIIAQNKPEQKLKNSIAVRNSYTPEKREKCRKYLSNRWLNDTNFKIKALKNLEWTQHDNKYRQELVLKSIGSGGLSGIYKNIIYESALELSYILWCEDNNIDVKNYDIEPIKYKDEVGKDRLYFPDFIINNTTIVEIKGFGLYYKRSFDRVNCKLHQLKQWCLDNKFEYIFLLEKDKILQTNYKRARKLHHENKK